MALKHEQYFFIHIPKTAGTSFRTMLHENFSEEEIYPTVLEMKKIGRPYSNVKLVNSKDNVFYKGYKLINGHYPLLLADNMSNPYTILFLRCPIKRTLSNIFHFKSYIKKYKHASPYEILNSIPLIQTSNTYVRYLSSNLNTNSSLKTGSLKIAMDNLSKVNFVGSLENYKADLKRLSELTNLKLDSTITKNINKKKYKISNKVYKEIILRNQQDLILFHKFQYENN